MKIHSNYPKIAFGFAACSLLATTMLTSILLTGVAQAQERKDERKEEQAIKAEAERAKGKQPNILFIMGDDIGWMQPGIYHRGLMVGETPNIDRHRRRKARSSWTMSACRAAPPGATPSSPACIRCARA